MIGPEGAVRSFLSMATSHEPADSQDDRHVDSSLERTESPNESPDVSAAWRVIDANGNRATEGLRVVEDYVRFVLEDAFLSQACKALRHRVSRTLAGMSEVCRLAARSTETDIGTGISTKSEYQRAATAEIVTANVRRAAEALRTLEEFAKLVVVEAARDFESQRYELYTLEKSILHLRRGRAKLQDALLYVLVDLHYGTGDEFDRRVGEMLSGGVDVVQLRDKQCADRELLSAARRLRELTSQHNATFIVNDRPDIARLANADGVHVGQDELTVADTRKILAPDVLVGVSTHSLEQARRAVTDGADYIGVGPVFPSATKSFEHHAGVGLVAEVAGEVGLPAFAIGGVSANNIGEIIAAGGQRVAVSNAVWRAESPGDAAGRIREALTATASEMVSSQPQVPEE